jgi:hypothetical protein
MSDTVRLVQVAHSVTATRNHLKKTIDYGTTAEIAAYTGKKGELVLNTESKAINYLDGVTPGGFLPAAAIPVANSTTLPVSGPEVDGQLYLLRSVDANDVIQICGLNHLGQYVWKAITGTQIDTVAPFLSAAATWTSNSSVHTVVYTFSEKVQLKQENVWNIVHAEDVTPDLFKVFLYDGGYDIYNPVANVAITAVSFDPTGTIVTFNLDVAPAANTYVIDCQGYQIIDLSSNEVPASANGIFTVI